MDDTFGSDAFGDIDDEELIRLTIAAEKQHEMETKPQAGVRTPKTPGQSKQQQEENYDELLEGAFDSDDLELSFLGQTTTKTTETPRREIGGTGQRTLPASFGRAGSNAGGLQQSTLFGGRVAESLGNGGSGMENQAGQATAAINTNGQERPTHHRLDEEAIKTWVYPTNMAQRDYQFNIVKKALLTNTLVALPTGLGKTFIAAVVMLNFFRWAPDSQIAFLAPTKPLVEQQIHACFDICGMPRSQTAVMTGNVATKTRAEYWQDRRVFFTTPQTMHNDLKRGTADPKRLVCLVIDEAHRATGSYAYVEVVKHLRRFNTSFRILALTATPGSKVETVQEIITNLHLSHIQIRSEDALDIQPYLHRKQTETHILDLSPEILAIRKLYATCLDPILKTLVDKKAYFGKNAEYLNSFSLHSAKTDWLRTPAAQNAHWGFKKPILDAFGFLAQLAHPLTLLNFHGITVFYNALLSIRTESRSGKSEGGKLRQSFFNSEEFRELMEKIEEVRSDPNIPSHPKMEFLIGAVLRHLSECQERGEETRVIVFSSFRDSADDIVKELNKHDPLVKANIFVGQADAKGSSGMSQKIQLETLEKFKKGAFNTLVATSIGEEGLDIGEVDLIICYDSNASPIRMLQRMGRTGRKRNGNIILLLTKGKEEEQSLKAKDNYNFMQRLIEKGDRFTYCQDAPRILPPGVEPRCEKKVIEINRNEPEPTGRPGGKKRITKMPEKKFFMPDGAITGFLTGSGKKISTPKALKENKAAFTLDSDPEEVDPDKEVAEIDPDAKCTLTEEEERELRYIYTDVPDASQIVITYPDSSRFYHLQGTYRPTRLVSHSAATRRFQRLRDTVAELVVDCDYISRLHGAQREALELLENPELPGYVSETEQLTTVEKLLRSVGVGGGKVLGDLDSNITPASRRKSTKSSGAAGKRKSLDAFLNLDLSDEEKTKKKPKAAPTKPAAKPRKSTAKSAAKPKGVKEEKQATLDPFELAVSTISKERKRRESGLGLPADESSSKTANNRKPTPDPFEIPSDDDFPPPPPPPPKSATKLRTPTPDPYEIPHVTPPPVVVKCTTKKRAPAKKKDPPPPKEPKKKKEPTPDFLDLTSSQDAAIGSAFAAAQTSKPKRARAVKPSKPARPAPKSTPSLGVGSSPALPPLHILPPSFTSPPPKPSSKAPKAPKAKPAARTSTATRKGFTSALSILPPSEASEVPEGDTTDDDAIPLGGYGDEDDEGPGIAIRSSSPMMTQFVDEEPSSSMKRFVVSDSEEDGEGESDDEGERTFEDMEEIDLLGSDGEGEVDPLDDLLLGDEDVEFMGKKKGKGKSKSYDLTSDDLDLDLDDPTPKAKKTGKSYDLTSEDEVTIIEDSPVKKRGKRKVMEKVEVGPKRRRLVKGKR
ncbi:P-loop containing nucleoside triphosphate hydrolase protein [Ascobolus immersus RN42]|uniref:ATP-dependent DNA helicase n=1 Tax=Ascobolus immersus RN42 TaxID=1160509 RepID=A0A3N4IKI8_ASCIM|nr:P-loop containing nucleoside triphosphate hydrolase protein [Ascobolus immersus RN42]